MCVWHVFIKVLTYLLTIWKRCLWKSVANLCMALNYSSLPGCPTLLPSADFAPAGFPVPFPKIKSSRPIISYEMRSEGRLFTLAQNRLLGETAEQLKFWMNSEFRPIPSGPAWSGSRAVHRSGGKATVRFLNYWHFYYLLFPEMSKMQLVADRDAGIQPRPRTVHTFPVVDNTADVHLTWPLCPRESQ